MTDILKDIEGAAESALDIRTKLIIGLAAAISLTGAAIFFADHFEAKGRTLERAGWLAKQVLEQQKDAALIEQHQQDMNALEKHHLLIERQTTDDHEKELAQLRLERDADRRRADAAGGLRIPAPACPAGSAVDAPAAAGAGGRDDAGASTVRLPEPIENDLWNIVDDADEVSAQLRSCQGWIRANGFYGPPDGESKELLDRITAVKNSSEAIP